MSNDDVTYRIRSFNRRYPRYVTSTMMNTWSTNINQGNFVRFTADTTFIQSAPSYNKNKGSGHSGSSSSSGGGSSRGSSGRGGSW